MHCTVIFVCACCFEPVTIRLPLLQWPAGEGWGRAGTGMDHGLLVEPRHHLPDLNSSVAIKTRARRTTPTNSSQGPWRITALYSKGSSIRNCQQNIMIIIHIIKSGVITLGRTTGFWKEWVFSRFSGKSEAAKREYAKGRPGLRPCRSFAVALEKVMSVSLASDVRTPRPTRRPLEKVEVFSFKSTPRR